MKYDIQVNPMNPVEYLACCGIFEILARFDVNATSWWEFESQPCFWLESDVDESSLLTCLIQCFSDWNQWQRRDEENPNDELLFSENNGESVAEPDSEEGESNEGISLSPQFFLNDKAITLILDWWYETLTPKKKINKKSAWKMYAGQQTAENIYSKMIEEATQLLLKNQIKNLSELIKLFTGMKGRFGFDPRSSRNALDAGFSANDSGLPVATYLYAEILAGIAAQHFFPSRNRQSGGITSARGWIENDVFQYAIWKTPLPIQLARLAAIGAAINKDDVIPFQAKRANRDKYSNFKMATMTTWKANN